MARLLTARRVAANIAKLPEADRRAATGDRLEI
jgi:hypothetical protein